LYPPRRHAADLTVDLIRERPIQMLCNAFVPVGWLVLQVSNASPLAARLTGLDLLLELGQPFAAISRVESLALPSGIAQRLPVGLFLTEYQVRRVTAEDRVPTMTVHGRAIFETPMGPVVIPIEAQGCAVEVHAR
jgi:hypothetical protein